MRQLILVATLLTSILSATAIYEQIPDECTLKILTPDLGDVKRAKIRLENGLEILLISDPGVHQSCGALAVDAGSWQDSEEYPGIAHFLEHMLFMGTKAYPKEAEYMQFISDHGGARNAYTASNRTVYGFSINNDALDGALDRFSHFFIDPLFSQASADRELQAVDQEHAKNIEHDGWRGFMILKETGNPSHPNAKFSTGNKQTLSGIPRKALQKWYEEHYTADQMHLVVISPFPIEEMIEMTINKFNRIANRSLPTAAYPSDLFSQQQLGHFLYVTPIKDVKSLSLLWQLPLEIALDQETHAADLVSRALANGAENGLCEELKREKLIEGLSVSVDFLSRECALMSIDFSLTDQGIQAVDTIIERSFQTINRLKETGIPQYIFDENQKLALMQYEYQSRENPFEQAMDIAGELTEEKLATYPQKLVLATHFDPSQVQSVLNALRPENCVYLVTADPKLTGVTPTAQEKWMDASYAIKEIPSDQLVTWSALCPHPQIDLPPPNPYFPDSLELVQTDLEGQTPTSLVNDEFGHLYFLQDQKYRVPEITAILSLKTPEMDGSATSKALFDLYSKALGDKLRSTLFFAGQAGLALTASQGTSSFDICVSGYSEKAPLFLKTIFEALPTVSPTQAEFEIYKQSLLSSYDNASKELPLKQAFQTLNTILLSSSPTSEAKLAALQQISYEQFLSFAYVVFQKTYLEGTIYGNLAALDAAQIWSDYQTALHPAPFPKMDHHRKAVFVPPDAQGPFMIVQSTERQGNGALLLLHEGSFSMENRAIQQILSAALQDDFFDTLRSKQQTGYIATSSDIEIEQELFQVFGVQSITHSTTELLARFELFLEEFSRDIQEKVSSDRFETLKRTLIKDLGKPPENLPGRAAQLHLFAFEKEGDFQWPEKRIASVEKLSYEQFVKTAKDFLSRQNRHRIAVLMEGALPSQNRFSYEPISPEQIRTVGTYVSSKDGRAKSAEVIVHEGED